MTPEPCLVDEGLSLTDAMDRMVANNIRHLVVTRGDRAVGVLDLTDVMLANDLAQEGASELPVMRAARGLYCCPPDMPLPDVVHTMEANHFSCAVVMEDDRTIGIFTLTDALRALRETLLGHPVEPLVVPTHQALPATEREVLPPRARVRRLVAAHGAMPSPNDGKAFGGTGF